MSKNPLNIIKESDSLLFDSIQSARDLALKEGVLSIREKALIAVALDASKGAVNGVKSLAKLALEAGATKEEVMEALRVAYFICGVGCIYTAAEALDEVFDD